MPHSRPIRLPRADFNKTPIPLTLCSGLEFLRVHGLDFPAINFRLYSGHRFSHPDSPSGLLYGADDLETCLWECFGDGIFDHDSVISLTVWDSRKVSRITASSAFKICDLTDLQTRTALRLDLSALKNHELSIPQAWGLAIQNHPDTIDGIRYLSRFTSKPCVALFQRTEISAKLKEKAISMLSDLDAAEEFLETNAIALV